MILDCLFDVDGCYGMGTVCTLNYDKDVGLDTYMYEYCCVVRSTSSHILFTRGAGESTWRRTCQSECDTDFITHTFLFKDFSNDLRGRRNDLDT